VDNAAARLLIVENSRIATALAACARDASTPAAARVELKRPLLLQRLARQIEAAYRDSPPGS
jgi:hypothetical protein